MKMKSVYCYMLAGLMLSASSCSSWLSEDDAPVMSYDYYETEAGVNAAIIVAANVFIAILLSTLVYRIEKMTAAKLFGVFFLFFIHSKHASGCPDNRHYQGKNEQSKINPIFLHCSFPLSVPASFRFPAVPVFPVHMEYTADGYEWWFPHPAYSRFQGHMACQTADGYDYVH